MSVIRRILLQICEKKSQQPTSFILQMVRNSESDQLAALVLVEGDEGHEERLDLCDVHGCVLREDLGGEWMMSWIFPQTSRGSFSAVSTPIFASNY